MREWLRHPHRIFAAMALFSLTLGLAALYPSLCASAQPGSVRLPPGFLIEKYADVPGARSLALGEKGTVFVGTRSGDSVYAVTDADGDQRGETVRVVAQGLNSPNGVAVKDGDLYVAEISRILRFPAIEGRLDDPPAYEVVADSYPTDRHHGWKYIAFGPDGYLYVPVGAPCNVCDEPDPYSSITRLDVNTGRFEVFARGIRNTVGFDWHPDTGELWFTNNGRDMMGDDLPPESLNRADRAGLHFGFPYCHAGVPDPDLGRDCNAYEAPAMTMPAHVAPLGMAFYTGTMFPEEYRGRVFIAEHGSWNRTTPIGYRVSMGVFGPDGGLTYEMFAEGWLAGGEAWGRPVDVLVMADGAILVSDDRAGVLWRISYQGP